MEDTDINRLKPNSFHSKIFYLKEFKLTGESLKLRMRANSSFIPSLDNLSYCLDFVPKLK
jgi:hypothetical protein